MITLKTMVDNGWRYPLLLSRLLNTFHQPSERLPIRLKTYLLKIGVKLDKIVDKIAGCVQSKI
jgi:hypothetical protein